MAAGNGIIGALLVSLGLDTAAFDTGLKGAKDKAAGFGSSIAGLVGPGLLGAAALAATAGAAFIKFGQDSLSVADDVGDAAARLGIGAEAYQKLGIAATAAGGTPELMSEAMDKLNENMGAFVQNGGGKAADAFKQLGIAGQITSGQLQTADQVFYAAVSAMENIEDPALKARIAMQLFGKSAGVDMLEVVAAGSDALKGYGEAAQDAGRIMSDEMVAKLSDAKLALDNASTAAGQMATVMAGEAVVAIVDMAKELTPLWEQVKTLWSQVVEFLMPSITELGAAIMNFAQGPAGKFFIELFREIGQLLGTAVVVAINVSVKAFTMLFNVVDAVGRFIAGAIEKMAGAFDWLRRVTGGLINIVMPVAPAYKAMATEVAQVHAPAMVNGVEKQFKRLPQVMTDVAKKETAKVTKAFNDMWEVRKDYAEWSEKNDGKIGNPELGKMDDKSINTGLPDIDANDYKAKQKQVFAETFTDGIMAALNGDLGSLFTRWWQDSLTKSLDSLGAKLFDLIGSFGTGTTGSAGSLFSSIGSAVSSIFSSSPKFAAGGSVGIKGGGGIDSRLFSAWVSPSEIINIGKPEDLTGGAMTLHVEASPWFDVRAKNAADPVARNYAGKAASAGTQGGAALAEVQSARRQRSAIV